MRSGLSERTQAHIRSLLEIDRKIMECAQRGSELIRYGQGATERARHEIEWLQTLYSHRNLTLNGLRLKGITEREIYGTDEGEEIHALADEMAEEL